MKPQNLILLSILIIFAIGFFAVPDVFADRTYTNQKYDFSLQYPANWKVSELHSIDRAAGIEYIVHLTSPEYEAGSVTRDGWTPGIWYAEDNIIISRALSSDLPPLSTTSLKNTSNLMFSGIKEACKNLTFQSNGQKCKNPKLMDDTIHTIGTHSKIDTVKIVASTTNWFEQGVTYYPLYITIAWHDPVDKHNWQINVIAADMRADGTSGADVIYGITNSFTFDRPSDYSPPEATGGCLIATAAFGSELAPQVQLLREIRDNTVLQTESGYAFMTGFNQFYYSFSPAVADYERENPAFKEAVKITLTPLLTSLTLLQYADIDSESEMLGYGIGIILLNIGMYFVAPAVLIMKIRK
jgi:hypothetical protein